MTTLDLSSIDLRDEHLVMTYELIAAGYDDRAIARMVRSGALHRLRHGAYTFGPLWTRLDARQRRMLLARATLRCARSPAALAGPSAADVFDVPIWDMGDHTHLARLDQRANRRKTRKVQHRGSLLAEDLTIRDGVPLTNGTRTALDMIAITDVPHALVTVNGLLHARETTPELLARRAAGMQHDPFTADTSIVLDLADSRCESAGESLFVHLCWAHGLAMPVPQFEVRDGRGRLIARVDFAWPERGVYLEFDGKIKYDELLRPGETAADVVMREKRREQLVAGITGWRCIRITWADLFEPERLAARIRAAIAGRPWAA
ncbi:MAG TPA: type IV toxin-antitoxin system AbiEi family antitoxin domain-containing protein [Nocardioides sp.]|nr:type IV toxin-antitoxin system AbiEi family antitoxin domain-containing protein [Nocardioides sp.]